MTILQTPFDVKEKSQPEQISTSEALTLAREEMNTLYEKGFTNLMEHDYSVPKKYIAALEKEGDPNQYAIRELTDEVVSYLGIPQSDDVKHNVRSKTQGIYSCETVVAIICHECTRYFMSHHQLEFGENHKKEACIDIMANLIGFSKILQKAYEDRMYFVQMKKKGFFNNLPGMTKYETKCETMTSGPISGHTCEAIERERNYFIQEKETERRIKSEIERAKTEAAEKCEK